jgi:ribosome-associated protein
MPKSDESPPEPFSKTQRKKDMHALQEIGKILVNLSESQLAAISLPEDLRSAINEARSLKSHESVRRQFQYIGKKMRGIDPEPIQLALKKIQSTKQVKTAHFHQIEQWRDQLIAAGDEALQKLLEVYPQANRQQLRQLIRKAQHDRANDKKTGGELELFRYLQALFVEK